MDKKKIKQLVFDILTKNEATRNSDRLLYIEVCKITNPDLVGLPFADVYGNSALPCAETVRRSRQWCQRRYRELAADVNVQAARECEEAEYKEVFAGYDGRSLDKYL